MKLLLFFSFACASAIAQIQPAAVTLGPGQTQQFSLSCPRRSCTYDWGITTLWCGDGGVVAGTLNQQTGLYTAPMKITSRQTVFVAVSLNGEFNCGAVVTLQPPAVGCPCVKQNVPVWDDEFLWLCAGGRWGRVPIQFQ